MIYLIVFQLLKGLYIPCCYLLPFALVCNQCLSLAGGNMFRNVKRLARARVHVPLFGLAGGNHG